MDAAAGQPHGEAVVVVVAAVDFAGVGAGRGQFDDGGAAEFAAPHHQHFVQHAALFQILEQGGDGLIAFLAELAVAGFDVVVVIPRLAGAVPDLDEADAAFDQAAGDEHLPAMHGIAIHVADGCGSRLRSKASVASICMR